MQKKLFRWLDYHLLRRAAKKLVYDFDDAVYLKDAACSERLADYESPSRMKWFRETAKTSDLIIAANQELATAAATITNNATPIDIIPSAVFTGVSVKTDYAIAEKPVIGWVGSNISLRYLNYAYPAFRAVRERVDFELRVIADQTVKLDGIDVTFVPWSEQTQDDEIRAFDIGAMPLSDDPFSRGKSAYKLIQYMACGVPSVCSAVGMNKELIAAGCCLGSDTHEGFAESLLTLIRDETIRRDLGREGRAFVERCFSVEVIGEKLANALLKL